MDPRLDDGADVREAMQREIDLALAGQARNYDTLCSKSDGLGCRHDLWQALTAEELIGPSDGPFLKPA